MKYFVYIIYSPGSDIFYKGYTTDVGTRVHRHNSGREKSTKAYSPWILLWATKKDSRSQAMALERKLKNLDRFRLIQFILKYDEGISSPDALLKVKQWSGC